MAPAAAAAETPGTHAPAAAASANAQPAAAPRSASSCTPACQTQSRGRVRQKTTANSFSHGAVLTSLEEAPALLHSAQQLALGHRQQTVLMINLMKQKV